MHLGLGLGYLRLGLGYQRRRAPGGGSALAISGTPVTTATEDAAYAGFTVTASGGDGSYTYSLVGTWPAGITVDSATGEVSGTPTESGSFTGLSVRVTDGTSATADLDSFTLEVEAAAVTDPHFANVVLLLGFEGSDGSTTLTDESSKAHGAGTANGNAQIDTAQFKFGTSSGLFDGTGDYFSWADSADWRLSAANSDQFTVECWIRPQGFNSRIVGQGDPATSDFCWELRLDGSAHAVFNYSTNGTNELSVPSSNAISTSGFTHIAADKDSTGKIRVYVSGVMQDSFTYSNSAMFSSSAQLFLGTRSASLYFNGWIDELRITKGIARYASDAGFTVPAAAFPRS